MLDFKLMLKRQQELDSKIKGIRKRDLEDMNLSFRAEVIEFNETLGAEYSHKTWKTKVYTREQQLEEYVDIWFFIMQYCNELRYPYLAINNMEDEYKNLLGDKVFLKQAIRVLTECSLEEHLSLVISLLKYVADLMKFEDWEIMNMHLKKYWKNLERIGGEWN